MFKYTHFMVHDLINMPSRIFKYYRYDNVLNEKRLNGEIYLATPFDFNDPCDCQRDIINNAKQKVEENGNDWLLMKLQELGYNKEEQISLSQSLLDENSIDKYKVYKRQLEKVGILCLTPNHADTLMWGYYANNDGFCVEYDTNKLIHRIVISYVNNLDYYVTKFLFLDKRYNILPEKRTPALEINLIQKAKRSFTKRDLKLITNSFLNEKDPDEVIYFLQNIYLKRLAAADIKYHIEPNGSPASLFFEREDKINANKYFKKSKTWKHEEEFRVIVSLGGRQILRMGKDIIKGLYLGCNMKNEKIIEIAYLIQKLSLKVNLYKMRRLKNCGLQAISLDINRLTGTFSDVEQYLKERCNFYW